MTTARDLPRALVYGGVPVPWTVSWTAEAATRIDWCRHARARAICQAVAPGEGKPRFASPHFDRQRRCIVEGRCDLCGRTLRNRTKISLSNARPMPHAHRAWDVLQVEPLLHVECAVTSAEHCPRVKTALRDGTMIVRAVHRHAVQLAISRPEALHLYVPDYVADPRDRVIAHAKVQLLDWIERDPDWLFAKRGAMVGATCEL